MDVGDQKNYSKIFCSINPKTWEMKIPMLYKVVLHWDVHFLFLRLFQDAVKVTILIFHLIPIYNFKNELHNLN